MKENFKQYLTVKQNDFLQSDVVKRVLIVLLWFNISLIISFASKLSGSHSIQIFILTSIYFVYDDNKAKTFRGKALLHYRVILMCWLWKNAFSDWIIRTGELVFLQIKKKIQTI